MAEDVVQNVFLSMFQRIGHFDESRPSELYFLRNVVNAAIFIGYLSLFPCMWI
jgi:DNA-directed RNA polymerase specialized sigma24 family protein